MLFIIIIIFNSRFAYGKYIEKIFTKYITQIAIPVFIVESESQIVIEDINKNTVEEYNFIIKNFDETQINECEIIYNFELLGVNENIDFELINLKTNQKIEFENFISNNFSIGIEKEIHEYCFRINFSNCNIEKNTKINLKISTNI